LLANEELRQEIVQSIDVEKLIRKNLGRLAIPAAGIIPPGLIGHERRPLHKTLPPKRRSGIERELTCLLNPAYVGPYSSLAEDLFSALRQIGYRIRIVNQKLGDYREFHQLMEAAQADLTLQRWVGDYPDSDTFVSILHSEQKIAGRFCGSPEIDQLITSGRRETEPAIRSKIYSQIEEILQRQGLLLPLFHEQVFCFAGSYIEGFELNFFSPVVAYEKLSIRN
jgi:ABC-type transport system substrate-binding protein